MDAPTHVPVVPDAGARGQARTVTTTELAPRPGATGEPLPVVTVRGLRLSYGGRAVLDGLDPEARRGECFALLGPNGAGKTTTIEVLGGDRDAGEVRVLGEDPATAGRAWRARIGVVSQGESAGQALSVREILDHFAHYTSTPRPSGAGWPSRRGRRVWTRSPGDSSGHWCATWAPAGRRCC